MYPIVTTRSAGSKLWDVDGNEYVDLTNGFGMILFGHNPPFIREAIEAQLREGFEIGPQTTARRRRVADVAEMTGMERVAFCNTGSEAVTAAIRVARTVSGRDTIAMFAGAYHGVTRRGARPSDEGGRAPALDAYRPRHPVEHGREHPRPRLREPRGARHTESARGELAAVLVEPVQSRRPELQPVEFLRDVRAITEKTETALVFDEVVSGFRSHQGGAQSLFGIRADIATYGKVVGGGLPIGLVAGAARTWMRSTEASGATETTRSRSRCDVLRGDVRPPSTRARGRKAVLEQLSTKGRISSAHSTSGPRSSCTSSHAGRSVGAPVR